MAGTKYIEINLSFRTGKGFVFRDWFMETAPIQLDCDRRVVIHAIAEVKVLQNARKGAMVKAASWNANVINAMLISTRRVAPRVGGPIVVGTGRRQTKSVFCKKVPQIGRICSGLEARSKDMYLITRPRVGIGIQQHIQLGSKRAKSCKVSKSLPPLAANFIR